MNLDEDGIKFTLELLVQATATCHAERTDEFFEIDCTVSVLIEDVENVICEFARIAERKELLVYSTEFYLVELT